MSFIGPLPDFPKEGFWSCGYNGCTNPADYSVAKKYLRKTKKYWVLTHYEDEYVLSKSCAEHVRGHIDKPLTHDAKGEAQLCWVDITSTISEMGAHLVDPNYQPDSIRLIGEAVNLEQSELEEIVSGFRPYEAVKLDPDTWEPVSPKP
jgi:hypothetical protein